MGCPFLIGKHLQGIELSTTPKLIYHGLKSGNAPTEYYGFMVLRQKAPAIVWEYECSQYNKKEYISLVASTTATVDLWIF
jgi:hypothetical protein